MKKYKKVINNNKFKISAPTWHEKFDSPDGSYSVSDIQDYFEYILEKHGKKTGRITFKIKTEYYLKYLSPETMQIFGGTKSKITTDENSENVPQLEITQIVLIHCNFVNNDYQRNSRFLYTFVQTNNLHNY